MNPLGWLALVLVGGLLSWDWLRKRRLIAARPEAGDDSFLRAFRGEAATGADREVLEVRRRIAKELSLPASKLSPEDRLVELRDRYCSVVIGHLALGDLMDDLEAEARKAGLAPPSGLPETVGEYIAAALGYSFPQSTAP